MELWRAETATEEPALGVWQHHRAAEYWADRGKATRLRGGVWWRHRGQGIWSPIDLLTPLAADHVRRPTSTALAAFALVSGEDSLGTYQHVAFQDIGSYGPVRVNRDRRREVRRAMESHEFRLLESPEELIRQGWAMASEAAQSGHLWIPPDRKAYVQHCAELFRGTPAAVIAGFDEGGRLAGYMVSFAVGSNAYLEELFTAEWARRTFVGVGLYWCLASYWARVTGTTTIGLGRTVGGGHGVDRFKVAMGATVLDSPARARIQPLAAAYLTMRRPDSEVLAMTGNASGERDRQ